LISLSHLSDLNNYLEQNRHLPNFPGEKLKQEKDREIAELKARIQALGAQ